MDNWLKMAGEIADKMKEKGYEYFNIKHGGVGTDFKLGLAVYLHEASLNNTRPLFPIYMGSAVAATSPDNPCSWATFTIVEDEKKSLRIDTMNISMYECHDGALRTSLEVKIKSPDDIPSKTDAAKLIEDKWEKQSKGKDLKRDVSIYLKSQILKSKKSKGRKM